MSNIQIVRIINFTIGYWLLILLNLSYELELLIIDNFIDKFWIMYVKINIDNPQARHIHNAVNILKKGGPEESVSHLLRERLALCCVGTHRAIDGSSHLLPPIILYPYYFSVRQE